MDAGILQQIRHFQPREMTAYVSSQENRGYQTLCIMEHEDAKTYYFSTRRSAAAHGDVEICGFAVHLVRK